MIYADLKISDVVPHESNVRRSLGDLEELAASIAEQGILQPLVVAPFPGVVGRHVIIAGHRRHAAALKAHQVTVPCIVRNDLTDPAAQIEAMLVENLQRADLTVMEEAAAYEQLELLGVKPVQIAQATGRSRKIVASRLKLRRLPENAQRLVDNGQLSLADAEDLAQYADDAEIMAAVAEAEAHNVRYAARQVIWKREDEARRAEREAERKAEPAEPAAPREPSEWELRNAEREARRQAIEVSQASVNAWLDQRIRAGDTQLADQLLRAAMLAWLTEGEEDLSLLGVTECDEDTDETDHELAMRQVILEAPIEKVRLAAAISLSSVRYLGPWGYADRLASLVEAAGYVLSDAERELVDGAE